MAMGWVCHFNAVTQKSHNETIHTGNFHRKGYLMLHHLASATIQLCKLSQSYIAIFQHLLTNITRIVAIRYMYECMVKNNVSNYFSIKTYVCGAQKRLRLNETFVLSIQNICFG